MSPAGEHDRPAANRRAVLVLGPHRSGTSMVAKALQSAGVDLGRTLLAPNEDNPKGFYENARIVEFNDRLLKHLGICWDFVGPVPQSLPGDSAGQWHSEAQDILQQEFAGSAVIGMKDPRLCLLAPFWGKVLSQAGYALDHVLVIRNPIECARSQCTRLRRDPAFHFVGGDLAEGLLLWARYLHEALCYLEDRQFTIASHAAFLRVPEQAFSDLASILDLSPAPEARAEFCESFVDPALHRHALADAADTHDAQAAAAAQAFDRLESLAARRHPDGSAVAGVARQLAALVEPRGEVAFATQRMYVRARHAAVEANLELAEAKRILAFQEAALKAEALKSERLKGEVNQAVGRFAEERRTNETLRLQLAATRDRLRLILGDKDGKEIV